MPTTNPTPKFDHTPAPCPMPDCEGLLHITWTLGRTLTAGDLADVQDLLDAASHAHTASWDVGCTDGHRLLLPGPVGCDCDHTCVHGYDVDTQDDDRKFRKADLIRLRGLLEMAATR